MAWPLASRRARPLEEKLANRNCRQCLRVSNKTTSEETTMATTVDSRGETASLIGSDKVDGTPVYGADDRKIGSVQRVMIDKVSGTVAYAVI
jgi:hypothetical protein